MGKESPRYAPTFRDEAVRQVTSGGKPVAAIARDLGVSTRRYGNGSSRQLSMPVNGRMG